MIEHKEPELAPQVALAKQIITRLGDFSSLTAEDELLSNIKQLTTIFLDVGDLKLFPQEISGTY